jgi:hypothetical protein
MPGRARTCGRWSSRGGVELEEQTFDRISVMRRKASSVDVNTSTWITGA